MRFIDEVTLTVKAGDGGNGAVAFRRERFRPKGGPAGGDGGKGGDVVLRVDTNLSTLLDLRYRQKVQAKNGAPGQGKDRHGRGGESAVIRVPQGTVVFDHETGEQVGDLVDTAQSMIIARGGAGGRGNMRFVTSTNRAPRRAEPGVPGEAIVIRLELKLLADVGLVGLPNVGKSTLVSRLSRAKPEIADYPFTTLVPNLGVVEIGPGASFVMADIPGLVRGASEGAGLGARFLRHIQRTAVLLHMVAPDPAGENDLLDDYDALLKELEAFDPQLAGRPSMVGINKIDLPTARQAEPALRRALHQRGIDLVVFSAATGEGLDGLKRRLVDLMNEMKQSEAGAAAAAEENDASVPGDADGDAGLS